MHKFWLLAAFMLPVLSASAQMSDDFSDGNYNSDPIWLGDTSHFLVNAAAEFQLNAPTGGESLVGVPLNVPPDASWDIYLRLEFAASTSNKLRIALMTDALDAANSNGYAIEIGETGATDALRFYRKTGATNTLLATGVAGFVGTDPVDLHLRVTRLQSGLWTCQAAQGAGAMVDQFSVTDTEYAAGPDQFFAFHCIYTDTRKDKYFFDNISIEALPDMFPPSIIAHEIIDAATLQLQFSEPLDSVSARELTHYGFASGPSVQQAVWQATSPDRVTLNLNPAMANGQSYTLTAQGITDLAGNAMSLQTVAIEYLIVEPLLEFDVLINEIMFDPDPSVGLPAAEWLELYNRSDKIIRLSDLRLQDATSDPKPLPDGLLAPGSYVVLCSTSDFAALSPVSTQVMAMTSFPALNNTFDELTLSDAEGAVIDRVAYVSNWHSDPNKDDGGWSIERINPTTPCLSRTNWQSCPQLPGGSPGQANFSLSNAPDTSRPRPVFIYPTGVDRFRLTFNEGMDRAGVDDPAYYQFSPALAVADVEISPESREEVIITTVSPLQPGVLYSLTFQSGLVDCSGNSVFETDTLWVGLPQTPESRDLVVNEILFNPDTGGDRFVEIFNASDKVIDLKYLFLTNFIASDAEPVERERIIVPGEYLVFTTDALDIETRFEGVKPRQIVEMSLPSFDDREDNCGIYWSGPGQYVELDSFNYTDDYHNALLTIGDREGVSLERILPTGPTQSAANWISSARRGTPTLKNSQYDPLNAKNETRFLALSSARLSPDNDAYEDFLDITFSLPGEGYAAAATIFDASGIPVKRLLRQELVGVEDRLRWDGDYDDGTPARPGIYVLMAEIYAADGTVKREKASVALVRKWE